MPEIWDVLREMLETLNEKLMKENASTGYETPNKEYLNMMITVIEAILLLHRETSKEEKET